MAVARNPCRYCAKAFYDKRTGRRVMGFKEECDSCEWIKEHKQYLLSKRKYKPGELIKDLRTLLEQEYIILGTSTRHIEAIKSMSLRTVLKFIDLGRIRYAVKNDKGE